MKVKLHLTLLLMAVFIFSMLTNPLLAESSKVELKLWSGWPNMMDPAKPGLNMLQEMINEKGKAVNLSIKYTGGPEIFGPFQGAESIQAGMVDMAYTAAAYNTGTIPEVDAMKLIDSNPWDDRNNGVFDLMDKWHQEKGLKYLARPAAGQKFQAYLNKNITEPKLNGLTMRVVPIYIPLIKALGAKGVNTAGGEVYTALERGIVDGFFWGGREIRPWGWHEVVKYIWGPPFWSVDVYVFMNKNSWDKLDANQQKVLTEIMTEYEKKAYEAEVALQSEITQTLLNSGMKEIKFSDADTKWYLDMTVREGWEQALKKSKKVQAIKDILDRSR